MTERREYPKGNSRQIMDYNRFLSLTGEKIFLCLDRGILEVAKYLLNSRGGWRTSYATEWLEYAYTIPTEEEFQVLKQAIAEANIDMASCDDIVEAIRGVTAAITNSGSGSGCGCVGSGGDNVESVNDEPSTDIPPVSEWEEAGFPSEEAYQSHKCNVAQEILQNYIQTLRNWAGLFGTVGGLTIAIIAGLLLLTVPPAGLMLIVAAFGVLTGLDIGLLVNLSSIADTLEDQIDDLRCDLYNAATTGDAAAALRDAAEAAVTALSLGLAESAFMQIVDNLISNEELGKLFNEGYTSTVTGADCSSCGGCDDAEWSITNGTIISGTTTSTTATIESELGPPVNDEDRYWIIMGYTCDECFRLNISSSGWSAGDLGTFSIGSLVYLCADDGEYDLQFDVPPETWDGECFFPASSGGFQFNSRTPFTVTVTAVESGCTE